MLAGSNCRKNKNTTPVSKSKHHSISKNSSTAPCRVPALLSLLKEPDFADECRTPLPAECDTHPATTPHTSASVGNTRSYEGKCWSALCPSSLSRILIPFRAAIKTTRPSADHVISADYPDAGLLQRVHASYNQLTCRLITTTCQENKSLFINSHNLTQFAHLCVKRGNLSESESKRN